MTAVRLYLAAVTLLLARKAAAQWPQAATTQPSEIEKPDPFSCLCSDADPRNALYYNVTYTCLQQLVFGNCGEAFITNTITQLPEGYCEITCGRCACCQNATVSDVLKANNANSLLQAAQSAGFANQLASPASMFTLLAPTDAAFTAALPALGVSSLQAASASVLQTILDYHIIPPHAYINAVWTTPFFKASNGNGIPTVLPNANLTFKYAGGALTVTGASNSAKIVTPDLVACKSYVNIIDTVLTPPSGAQPAPLPASAGSITATFAPIPSAAQQAVAVEQGLAHAAAISTPGQAVPLSLSPATTPGPPPGAFVTTVLPDTAGK